MWNDIFSWYYSLSWSLRNSKLFIYSLWPPVPNILPKRPVTHVATWELVIKTRGSVPLRGSLRKYAGPCIVILSSGFCLEIMRPTQYGIISCTLSSNFSSAWPWKTCFARRLCERILVFSYIPSASHQEVIYLLICACPVRVLWHIFAQLGLGKVCPTRQSWSQILLSSYFP